MQQAFILIGLLLVLFTFSCKSYDIDDPTESIEKPDTTISNPPIDTKSIKQRSILYEINDYVIKPEIFENYFIGSLWDLKDTVNSFNITSISNKIINKELDFWSNNLTADIESNFPSYQNMTNYAKKFKTSINQVQSLSNGTFFDYSILQIYLKNSDKFNSVRSLFAVQDSTYIRKKHGIMFQRNVDYLTLNVDLMSVNNVYAEKYVDELLAGGIDPYFISSVTYGEQNVFLAETDSSRSSFNFAFQKLLGENTLNTSDLAVLDASNLLIYRRDSGSKDSFIRYGKGADEIKKYMKEYLVLSSSNQNKIDYPLSFTLHSLKDYSALRYNLKFNMLEIVK